MFIFISSLVFIFFIKNDTKKIKLTLFSTIASIGFLFFIYLLFNYLTLGSFASENQRVNNELDTFWFDTYVDFVGLINLANPFFYLKTFDYLSKTKIIISFVLIFIDLIFWYLSIYILKKNKNFEQYKRYFKTTEKDGVIKFTNLRKDFEWVELLKQFQM